MFSKSDGIKAGFTAFTASMWVSESSMSGRFPSGSARDLSVTVSVFPLSDVLSRSFSYQLPGPASVAPGNGAANGNYNILVSGSSFAVTSVSQRLRLGFTACVSSIWTSESSMICKSPSGVSRGISDTVVAASVGLQSNTVSAAFSYDGFLITGFTPLTSSSTGFNSVPVLGIGFGSVDYCVLTLIGATSCEASVWVSDAQLNCKTSSGTGQALNGKILGGSRANIYEAALSYAAATVSSASPALLPVTGSALVTLFGSGYGIASSSSSARFGHSIASHMFGNLTAVLYPNVSLGLCGLLQRQFHLDPNKRILT